MLANKIDRPDAAGLTDLTNGLGDYVTDLSYYAKVKSPPSIQYSLFKAVDFLEYATKMF